MKELLILSFVCLVLNITELFAQIRYKNFSVSLNGNYTTTAKIYLNPNSTEVDLKNRYTEVSDIFSPSVDIRYSIAEDILIGFSTEYLYKISPLFITVIGPGGIESISINDGFRLIPFEVSAYYLMPFSNDKFKFLIGGGLAYYYGSHIRKFGDEEISNIKREFAYGIQVSTSADYMINELLSVRGEMKFRDPEFETTNRYNKITVSYNGQIIRLGQDKFDSKINIDGITFILGLAVHF
jgi:outer membrane protein W